MTAPPRRKPKGLFRRAERLMMGAVMSVMAFVLERIVMRSVKRGGGSPKRGPATSITTKGAEVDLDPDAG